MLLASLPIALLSPWILCPGSAERSKDSISNHLPGCFHHFDSRPFDFDDLRIGKVEFNKDITGRPGDVLPKLAVCDSNLRARLAAVNQHLLSRFRRYNRPSCSRYPFRFRVHCLVEIGDDPDGFSVVRQKKRTLQGDGTLRFLNATATRAHWLARMLQNPSPVRCECNIRA